MPSFRERLRLSKFASASSSAAEVTVDGDTQARLKIDAGGKFTWGSGSATGDVTLYRDGADVLKTDDTFKASALYVDSIEIDTTGAVTDNVLVFDGTKFAPGEGGGSGSITVSDTAPSSPSVGDLWFNSVNGKTYVYYDGYWIQQSAGEDGATGPQGPAGSNATVTEASIISAIGGDGTNGQAIVTDGSGNLSFSTIVGTTEASIITAVGADGTSGQVLKTNGAGDLSFGDVALGTNTTGNYVAGISGTTDQISVSGSGSENASVTLSLPQNIATTSSPTFAGVTADNIQVGVTGANEIDTSTGNLTIDSAGGTVTIDDNLIVSGDLTVSGTTTTLNTENLLVEDNIIVLNSGVTGSPSLNAGVEIERGDSTNVQIRWNETLDKWQLTNDGTNYDNIQTVQKVNNMMVFAMMEVSP
jgi:hypothetical protein